MLVNNTIISRIIIGLFLISLTCWLPASGADNVSVTPVTTPFITIDPIGNHTVGEVFFLNGTTNLPTSDNISMEFHEFWQLRGSSIKNGRPLEIFTLEKIPIIRTKSGMNRWSVNITDIAIQNLTNTSYLVVIGNSNAAATVEFTLLTIQTSSPTLSASNTILPIINKTTNPSTTPTSSLPFFLSIITIEVIVILRFIRSKKSD
jgi:hypothetical protein